MTITYKYQYRFFPKQWSAPKLPTFNEEKVEDLVATVEQRNLIVAYIKNWLDVLNTWRFLIKYGVMPITIALLTFGWIGLSAFTILLATVGIASFFIWIRIKAYQRTASIIQLVIDVVLNDSFSISLPKTLERE